MAKPRRPRRRSLSRPRPTRYAPAIEDTAGARTRRNGTGDRTPRTTHLPRWVALGRILSGHLTRLGLSQAALGRMLGTHKTLVQQVCDGAIPVPRQKIEPMADALDLRGKQRRVFVLLGWLAHTPEAVVDQVARLDREIGRAMRAALRAG